MITKRDSDLDILAKAVSDETIVLPPELIARKKRIEHVQTLYFSESFKFQSENELAKVITTYHRVSLSIARRDVEIFKQLYVYSNPVDWKFERALLLYSVKNNINAARAEGDLKTVQKEHKNLIDMIGEDKDGGEARAVHINVINYNPTLVGAVEIPDLEKMIESMIAKDKKAEEAAFNDFEDA
jgi:hypothetical protein